MMFAGRTGPVTWTTRFTSFAENDAAVPPTANDAARRAFRAPK